MSAGLATVMVLALASSQLAKDGTDEATEQAARRVEAALARGETASLRNLQGAIEAKRENIKGAAEAFRRAVELDPTEPHIFDLGNHLQRYRGFADAVKIFEYGLARYPRSARLHVGLGIARYSLGEYDAAVEALCRAVDIDPADGRPLTFLGTVHDVSPALADEVRKRLERFVKRYPQNAQAHYFYALSLWKRHADQPEGGDIATAEKHLRAALALDGKFAPAHFQLGLLLEDSARTTLAIAAYARAVELDSSYLKAHYRLAQLYSRTGNGAASLRHRRLFQRLQAAERK